MPLEENVIEENENVADKPTQQRYRPGFWFGFIFGSALVFIICMSTFRFSNDLPMFTQMKVGKLEKIIDQYYMGERDVKAESDGVYRGVVYSLGDEYSAYLTADELQRFSEENSGEFYGIGCTIGLDSDVGVCYVASVTEGYAAERAGIKEGDYFLKIDGEDVTKWSPTEVSMHVRGDLGTTVDLTLLRDKQELSFSVERVNVKVDTVESRMEDEKDKIGYIRIKEFDVVTVGQFLAAKQSLEEQGMKSLILDLRSNPGGMVEVAAEIGNYLLPEGLITRAETKDNQTLEWFSDGKHEIDYPVIILINEMTASASEILTGAMRDYGKAKLLGTTTYGKGVVQNAFNLGDGTAVKFTIGQYCLPKGETIHKVGIDPDIKLEFDAEAYLKDESDNQLTAALNELKKGM